MSQFVGGIFIGIGIALFLGSYGWMLATILRMQRAVRNRLPYDGQKYAENEAAALLWLRNELRTKLDGVDNAIEWNRKLLSLGKKSKHNAEEEL